MRFLFLALFLFTTALAPAQITATANEQLSPEAKQKAIDMIVMVLSQSLSLTPDQQSKIRPILKEKFKKAEEIHNDASLSDEQKQAKWKDLYESGRNQISALLNPQQKATLDQLASAYTSKNGALANPTGP